MRKGLVFGLLGIVAACLFLYGVFIVLPRPHHPEVIEQAFDAGQKSFALAQVDANDPAKNGWLSPTFLPFWGRMGKEYVSGAPVGEVVMAWVGYSTPGAGKEIDHKKLLSDKDPEFLAAMNAFEKIAPELQEALSAPRFVAPEANLSYSKVVMNYIAVRSAAHGMVGLAELRLAQGKPVEAMDALASTINLGKNMRSQSGVVSDAIGVAITSIGADAFAATVDPRSAAVPASQWKKMASAFTAAVPAKDQLLTAAQMEVVACNASFDEVAKGVASGEDSDPSTEVIPLLISLNKAPGMLGRERRIFNNMMADQLDDLKGGRPPRVDDLDIPGTTDMVVGKWGFATSDLAPRLGRTLLFMEHDRRRLVGLATMSGIAAYLAEKKALPADLEQVRGLASIPDAATLTEIGVTYKPEGGKGILTVPQSKTMDMDPPGSLPPRPWFKQDKTALVWTI